MESPSLRPLGVTAIATINAIATVITIAFWILVQQKLFGHNSHIGIDKSSAASTLGFMVADITWGIPMLIISIPGLLGLHFWGWTAAQMANILWLYPVTAGWVRDLYLGNVSPGNVLFLPFALFSIWATIYLWRSRQLFWQN